MLKLNLLNLFGLLKSSEFFKFSCFCLLILMPLKKTVESDFLAPTVFTIICSVMVHLFSFMFISHLWTEEKSEGVALHAPFISKSECLPTSQSLAIALCGNFPNLFRNWFIIKIDSFVIITYLIPTSQWLTVARFRTI